LTQKFILSCLDESTSFGPFVLFAEVEEGEVFYGAWRA